MSDEKYPLLYPVALPSGDVIKEVMMADRIKGKHLRRILNAQGNGDQAIAMISAMTGLDEDIIDEFDNADINNLSTQFEKKALKTSLVKSVT
jgi:hypothetical protein